MLGEEWQQKTAMTVCASWAQHRHAWALQTKPNVIYLGLASGGQSFIEPCPEFYQRLSTVCDTLAETSRHLEAWRDIPGELEAELAAFVVRFGGKITDEAEFEMETERLLILAQWLDVEFDHDWFIKAPVGSERIKLAQKTREALDKADARKLLALASAEKASSADLTSLWRSLSHICLRLALLSHKQLDAVSFTDAENEWLTNIGARLAEIMLYQGNSYLTPKDDAPKVARISSRPGSGQILHAGIGRPRLLHVLYPWQGREVFCQGVVLPYHESNEATSLTDEEWRQRFKGQERPSVPAWLKDFVPLDAVGLK